MSESDKSGGSIFGEFVSNALSFFRNCQAPNCYIRDGAPPPPYLGGCKLHGHSLDIPPESEPEDDKSHFHDSGSPLESPLTTRSPCDGPGGHPASPRLPSRGHTPPFDHSHCSPAMHKSCVCVNFIAEHTRAKEDATKARKQNIHNFSFIHSIFFTG